MKHKIFYFIILMSLFMACSKDKNEDPVSLTLQLIKSNSFSSVFSYHYDSRIENISLIWGKTGIIDINSKIGEKKLTSTDAVETVNNLDQKTTYYFRLVGKIGGKEIMSNIISTTTSEIKVTFNKQIHSSQSFYLNEVLSVSDGFIIGSYNTPSEIIKIDKNYNLLWSLTIHDEGRQDSLKEIIGLKDGTYIAFLSGNKNTSVGTYNTKTYAVKFNNLGKILWTKFYNYKNREDLDFWYNNLLRTNTYNGNIVLLTVVDTTYHKTEDKFFREFTLDKEGNIISDKLISGEKGKLFNEITYDKYGNKYNVGSDHLKTYGALIEKFDSNNNLLWSHLYGGSGDNRFEKIAVNENSLVSIGRDNVQTAVKFEWDEFRWVFCTDLQGSKLWDYQENRKDFLYQARDVITDLDGNTLALFMDIYYPDSHVYNTATLLKFNNKGDLNWKYVDGEDFNKDNFNPVKVFYENGEYLIFGIKDGLWLWLKKIRVE